MKKATFECVTKQKTPSEKNCSRGFFRIFVNQLSVKRNHSLTSENYQISLMTWFDPRWGTLGQLRVFLVLILQ